MTQDFTKPQPALRKAIAFTCDQNYQPFALFAASQIAALHPHRDFDILICDDTAPTLPPGLDWLGVRAVGLDTEGVFEGFIGEARHALSTYYRLLLPGRLASQYDRILYLDADIFVQGGDFSALLEADLHGRPLAAIRDNPQWRSPRRKPAEFTSFGLPNAPYFNGGLLLLDVAQWMMQNVEARALDFAMRNRGRLKRHDQTVLNCVLHRNWAELSPIWNWQYSQRAQLFEAMTSANILHFIGPTKPWNAPPGRLPPRFGRELARFLDAHFPERRIEVPSGPRPDQLGKMLVRHFLSRRRMARYLARFPTETSVLA